jgi:DNA-binding NarL/FixJ family response regulator
MWCIRAKERFGAYGHLVEQRNELNSLADVSAALRALTRGERRELNTPLSLTLRRGPRFEVIALLHYAARTLDTKPARAEIERCITTLAEDFPVDLRSLISLRAEEVQAAPSTMRAAALTKRETEILEILVMGLTNKEIAQRLSLSIRTVETHVDRILSKLGVTSRSRAIAMALRLELISVA